MYKEKKQSIDTKSLIIESLPCKKNEISEKLKRIKRSDTEKELEYMLKTGDIFLKDDIYISNTVYFREFVINSNIKDKYKKILLGRIDGLTLGDIASERNVSRELIRQEENKALSILSDEMYNLTGVSEELYKTKCFRDMKFRDFIPYTIFDSEFIEHESKRSKEFRSARYYFMRLYPYKVQSSEKKDIFRSISGKLDKLPEWFTADFIDYYKPLILQNGSVFEKYSGGVFLEILKEYGPFTWKELSEVYKEKRYTVRPYDEYEYKKYDNSLEGLKSRKRYFTYVFPLNKHIIRTGVNGLFRYYDIEKYEKALNKTLLSLKYPDFKGKTKNSIEKVFNINKDALKEVDINNYFELHSILRHKEELLPQNVKLGRVPTILVQ